MHAKTAKRKLIVGSSQFALLVQYTTVCIFLMDKTNEKEVNRYAARGGKSDPVIKDACH